MALIKKCLAFMLVLVMSFCIVACSTDTQDKADNKEKVDSVDKTESTKTEITENTVLTPLVTASSFISGKAKEKFEVNQAEVADGVTVSYVEAEAFNTTGEAYRVDIVKSKFEGVNLVEYDLNELALEFWIRSSDTRIISFNASNILKIGCGEYFEAFADQMQHLDFKGTVVLKLQAGEWQKVTIPLKDATDFGNITATEDIVWMRLLLQNLEEGVIISVSDMNIVKLNEN